MPALRTLIWLLPFALLFTACNRQKKAGEYDEAADSFNRIYRTKFDEAFLDERMSVIEGMLKEVPANSLDGPSAQALLKRIEEGRAKLVAERADQQKSLDDALKAPPSEGRAPETTLVGPEETQQPSTPNPSADAGQPVWRLPVPGMSRAELEKRFGFCFRKAAQLPVLGKGPRDTYELFDIETCRKQYPSLAGSLLVIDDEKIYAAVPKDQLDYRLPDGGKAPPMQDR